MRARRRRTLELTVLPVSGAFNASLVNKILAFNYKTTGLASRPKSAAGKRVDVDGPDVETRDTSKRETLLDRVGRGGDAFD